MATATLTFPSPGPTSLVVTQVVRTDTGAIVTAATAQVSALAWTLTITESVPNLTYLYTLLGTWADGSTAPVQNYVGPAQSTAAHQATDTGII